MTTAVKKDDNQTNWDCLDDVQNLNHPNLLKKCLTYQKLCLKICNLSLSTLKPDQKLYENHGTVFENWNQCMATCMKAHQASAMAADDTKMNSLEK
jgi:hypothetical protein